MKNKNLWFLTLHTTSVCSITQDAIIFETSVDLKTKFDEQFRTVHLQLDY